MPFTLYMYIYVGQNVRQHKKIPLIYGGLKIYIKGKFADGIV